MSDLVTAIGITTTILFPLMLAAMMTIRPSQALALRLIPLAALPALIMSAFAFEAEYTLPGFMLGGTFLVDGVTRLFLFMGGILMVIATALTATRRNAPQPGYQFFVLLLLFISATITAILAGDALSLFAAATVAGYALYGLIVQQGPSSAQRAGTVLIVLLVISDIVIFELLLLLGKYSDGVTFSAVQQGLIASKANVAIFTLLIIGFGIKAGIIGLHFWLAPVLSTTARPVRPLVVGFVFCAAALAWLRMIPLGVAHWPLHGAWLEWTALMMMAYASVTGLLQSHYRAVLAHVLMLLTALWLGVGGLILADPGLAPSVHSSWGTLALASVFALAALLLNRTVGSHDRFSPSRLLFGLNFVAAIVLALAPLHTIGALSTTGSHVPHVAGMCLALLSFRALRLQQARDETAIVHSVEIISVAILVLAALASSLLQWPTMAFGTAGGFVLAVAVAAGAGWYLTPILNHMPAVPPGDLLYVIRRALTYLLRRAQQLGETTLPRYRQQRTTALYNHINPQAWLQRLRPLEAGITRWETAIVTLVIVGIAIAIVVLAI